MPEELRYLSDKEFLKQAMLAMPKSRAAANRTLSLTIPEKTFAGILSHCPAFRGEARQCSLGKNWERPIL
jgi:hypothetical protein